MLDISWDTLIQLTTGSLLNCSSQPIPRADSYLNDIPLSYKISLAVASVLCAATLALGMLQLLYAVVYVGTKSRRMCIAYLATTAPFVSILSLVAMMMPRVWFLSHLISFLYFSVALWVIICLLMNIFEGHNSLVNKMYERDILINISTPPFCCVFPCLPKISMQERRIRICEYLVMQFPVVRLIATLVSLFLFFEYGEDAFTPVKVLDFITLPSLLLGIYGTHILVTTVSKLDELLSYRYIIVFRLLDLYFMVFGTQQPIFDFLARAGLFGCGAILPQLETAFFWKNLFTVIESFIVTLLPVLLLRPRQSALFDKHPESRSVSSMPSSISQQNVETTA